MLRVMYLNALVLRTKEENPSFQHTWKTLDLNRKYCFLIKETFDDDVGRKKRRDDEIKEEEGWSERFFVVGFDRG